MNHVSKPSNCIMSISSYRVMRIRDLYIVEDRDLENPAHRSAPMVIDRCTSEEEAIGLVNKLVGLSQ